MDILFNNGNKGTQSPAATGGLIKDGSAATFVKDVIEASQQVPVLVDFWAPWCGPCKTLTPLLEKLVTEAKGALRLVKLNIEENPQNQALAAQMRIQSVPAVYAFFGGRPVDGFVGAQSESQLRAFIKRLAAAAGPQDGGLEEALEMAAQAAAEGDVETALAVYQEILAQEADNVPALAGYLRLLTQLGHLDEAKQILGGLPADLARKPELAAVATTIELAEQATRSGPAADLRRKVAQNPDDHASRYDLAVAYYAAGEREAAVDELLELYRRDRNWNEEAARKQLVKMFEAFGPKDPLTLSARRRLSSLMFA